MAPPSAKDENSEKLTTKFLQLRSNALKTGLDSKQLRKALETTTQTTTTQSKSEKTWYQRVSAVLTDPAYRLHLVLVVVAVLIGATITVLEVYYDDIVQSPCLVFPNVISEEVYRPRVDCDMCRDVYHVPEERNLSVDDFYRKYAFSGRPVLVKEATANWTAMNHFSFQFFRKLYKETKGALNTVEEDCQFFPYNTEFLSLAEAFNMPEERAAFEEGQPPWYIGWSNCHEGVRVQLRKYYERPYFLPADSETVEEDWIFMGGSGPGASTHLDYVARPSWQAQISGTKTWELIPSPECESVCHSFNVTVHKGDIIVLDTNNWYHSTFVHPGEISITIGSEYD